MFESRQGHSFSILIHLHSLCSLSVNRDRYGNVNERFDKLTITIMDNSKYEFIVELNEKGIPIHNTLLLFPQDCVLTILRPLPRGDAVGVNLNHYSKGEMFITSNYPDDRFDKHRDLGKLKMELSLEYGEYSFSMVLNKGGPYYLRTEFISYGMLFYYEIETR